MRVTFELRTPPGKEEAVEYVSIDHGRDASVAHRKATDADRALYSEAYAVFKGEKPAPVYPEAAKPPDVSFSYVVPYGPKGESGEAVEYVQVLTGVDVVHRKATDADRNKKEWKEAYDAWKAANPTPPAAVVAPVETVAAEAEAPAEAPKEASAEAAEAAEAEGSFDPDTTPVDSLTRRFKKKK